ncbi:hypothetical protein D3C84_1218240 [compost metagenome]
MLAAERLHGIFPGYFIPQMIVTTNIICPQCVYLIQMSGGVLFSPRGAIWPAP